MTNHKSLNANPQPDVPERDWEDLTPAINDKDAPGAADSLLRARRAESGIETPARKKSVQDASALGTAESAADATDSAVAAVPAQEVPLPLSETGADTGTDSVAGSEAGDESVTHTPAASPGTDEPVSVVFPASIAEAQSEAEERASARDLAVEDKPRMLGVRKALITLAVPLVTLAVAVRTVATSGFLWLEYHHPGFPADSYGLGTDERMSLGSYGLSYILNFAPASYLGDLRNDEGVKWFLPSEVEHMTDVKIVMLVGMLLAVIVACAALFASHTFKERAAGAIRSSLFIGSWLTLVMMVGLGVVAALGWQNFFENFHKVFFPQGNWQFRESDTLIRLFPPQFWLDAGITVGVLALVLTVLVMVLTWPTKFRRAREQKIAADRLELRRKLSV